MQSALIVDAVVLAAVLEADLGGHRKINKFRLLRPLGIAAAIIPLYLTAVTTHGRGLTLEIVLALAGVILGLIATGFMTVYRSPRTCRPVSRAGAAYAALWTVVIGARAAFSYGSTHWFGPQLGHWMASNAVTADAITDALIFMAVAMILTRTIAMASRARHLPHLPAGNAIRELQRSEMTNSLTLATAHGGFPAPLTILLAVAALGYVLWSRTQGQPLKAKRLLVVPVVLTVIGVTDLTGSSAPHLTPKDIAFLVVTVAVSVVLGAARGATIELYPQHGELWQRYRRNTVALWIVLVTTKLVLTVIAGAAGASAGGGTRTLLLCLGVSLLAEAAIVVPRALSTGLPFATDHNHSDGGRPDPTRAGRGRPSLINRVHDVAAPTGRPAPPTNHGDPDDPPPWMSPRVSDGVSWLRHQTDQPTRKDRDLLLEVDRVT